MPGTWISAIQCLQEWATHDKHVKVLDTFSKQDWQSCFFVVFRLSSFSSTMLEANSRDKMNYRLFLTLICFLPLNEDNVPLPLGSYSRFVVSINVFHVTSRALWKLLNRIFIKLETCWVISKCNLLKNRSKKKKRNLTQQSCGQLPKAAT